MFSMVTARRFKAGSESGLGASSQDRPVLSIDQILEMISVEVSHILQEELFGVVNQVTARVIAKLEEKVMALQIVRDVAIGMNIAGVPVIGSQLGKRKRDFSAEDKELEDAELGTGS